MLSPVSFEIWKEQNDQSKEDVEYSLMLLCEQFLL